VQEQRQSVVQETGLQCNPKNNTVEELQKNLKKLKA
jgi:hypothetical protein